MDQHEALVVAVEEVHEVLGAALDADWGVVAGGLEWSCRETAAHVASGLFWYAGQLASGQTDGFLAFGTELDEPADTEALLDLVVAGGTVLARTVEGGRDADRAFHFYGISDPSGFAAMGTVETIVHAWDIAQGLGVRWTPSSRSCAPPIERLFPDAPAGDPSDVLLWCTGRRPLAGTPPRGSWRWDPTVRT